MRLVFPDIRDSREVDCFMEKLFLGTVRRELLWQPSTERYAVEKWENDYLKVSGKTYILTGTSHRQLHLVKFNEIIHDEKFVNLELCKEEVSPGNKGLLLPRHSLLNDLYEAVGKMSVPAEGAKQPETIDFVESGKKVAEDTGKIDFHRQIVELQPKLYRLAIKFTADKTTAADLVQDTIYRMLQRADRSLPVLNVEGWGMTILRRIFINDYRRAVSQSVLLDEYACEQEIFSGYGNPEVDFSVDYMEKAMDVLDVHARNCMTLTNAGYSYKEIAEKLKLSLGEVVGAVTRARKILQALLDPTKTP